VPVAGGEDHDESILQSAAGPDGTAKGSLFPASLVLAGSSLYVTNLALALTPNVGDEPEEDVRVYTVSRIPLGR